MADQSEAYQSDHWQTRDRFLELHSRWMTLIVEHLQNDRGEILEYWRVEKPDSVIVLPIQTDPSVPTARILLPAPSYRPGIGAVTLDFPGGRVASGHSPEQAARTVLTRELGIDVASVVSLLPLNHNGWAVNSSFSNQRLYGFMAHLIADRDRSEQVAVTYPATETGVQQLLPQLTCLQCRAVLLEWWLNAHETPG